MNAYDKAVQAVKEYLVDYYMMHGYCCGDDEFYILCYDTLYNCRNIWRLKTESCGPEPDDVICIFDSDYDEGQDITIIAVYTEFEVECILFKYTNERRYKKRDE